MGGCIDIDTADFSDAVLLVTFTDKALTCTDTDKVRVKLHFDRLENTGNGDAAKAIFAGPNKLAFSENQWIPLQDTHGDTIIDGGLVEDVPGLAFERGDGWIHIVSHGSHPNSSGKEIVDANVLFNHAYISSIRNDTNNPAENPRDGIVNDTASGDEFVDGPNAKSMTFKTRTTTQDDGVFIDWKVGEPSDASSSSSSSSTSSSSSSSSSSAGSTIVTDNCSVPFVIENGGTLRLKAKADVTVKIVGSDSTYGQRGPKVNVRSQISFDGGSNWKALFGSKSLRGGELTVFRDTLSGSRIALQFNGRYSWVFNKTAESERGDNRIRMLRNGESFEGLKEIVGRGEMHGYLKNLLDGNARMKLGNHDIAFLVELGDTEHANYHDAVAIISFDKPQSAGTCVVSSSASSTSSSVSSSSSIDNTDTDGDGIPNSRDLCPLGTVMPEAVPTEYMSFDRFALTSPRGNVSTVPVFRTGPRKKIGTYTLKDTRGCSCTQILDAIQDKGFHRFGDSPVLYRQMKNLFSFYVTDARKFGCSATLLKLIGDTQHDDDDGHN